MTFLITRNIIPQQFSIQLAAYSPARQAVSANLGAGLPAVQEVSITVNHVFAPQPIPDVTMEDHCPPEPT